MVAYSTVFFELINSGIISSFSFPKVVNLATGTIHHFYDINLLIARR